MKTFRISSLWLLGAVFLGCSEVIIEESATHAVLVGTVRDSVGVPVAGARLDASDHSYACDSGQRVSGALSGTAQSDTVGSFAMTLFDFLGTPGSHCVDLDVSRAGSTESTRVVGVEVLFGRVEGRDTTEIALTIPE